MEIVAYSKPFTIDEHPPNKIRVFQSSGDSLVPERELPLSILCEHWRVQGQNRAKCLWIQKFFLLIQLIWDQVKVSFTYSALVDRQNWCTLLAHL